MYIFKLYIVLLIFGDSGPLWSGAKVVTFQLGYTYNLVPKLLLCNEKIIMIEEETDKIWEKESYEG